MTDFASLLVADRGQKARPIHLVDKDSFDGWLKKRPAEDRALLEAHRFDGKTGVRLRAPAARRRLRGGQRGQERRRRSRPGASPSSARACPKAPTGSPRASPAPAALGWLLAPAPVRRLPLEEGRARARPARAGHRRAGADRRRRCASPKRPRWSATSSTRPPPTSARPSSRQAVRDEAKRSGGAGSRHQPATSSPKAIR